MGLTNLLKASWLLRAPPASWSCVPESYHYTTQVCSYFLIQKRHTVNFLDSKPRVYGISGQSQSLGKEKQCGCFRVAYSRAAPSLRLLSILQKMNPVGLFDLS